MASRMCLGHRAASGDLSSQFQIPNDEMTPIDLDAKCPCREALLHRGDLWHGDERTPLPSEARPSREGSVRRWT
jgi:hypothetical protein